MKNGTLIKKGKNIMKKIILLVFISLMFSNIGYAEMSLIEQTKVKDYQITTVCIDGYKFVVFDRMYKDGGASMVQFFTRAVGGVSLPKKC